MKLMIVSRPIYGTGNIKYGASFEPCKISERNVNKSAESSLRLRLARVFLPLISRQSLHLKPSFTCPKSPVLRHRSLVTTCHQASTIGEAKQLVGCPAAHLLPASTLALPGRCQTMQGPTSLLPCCVPSSVDDRATCWVAVLEAGC